ncbi:pyrolysin [Ceratobasidium sp. AG-Ba]|nr:pyrolysin [Ceratobasidium sp. AG-Ba]
MDPFDRWLEADSRLKAAVHEFIASCSALQNANPTDVSDPVLDDKIAQIRARKSSLAARGTIITRSQDTIDRVLARFPSRASFQGLPAELLVRIFGFAIPSHCRWQYTTWRNGLVKITSVCRRFREAAIGAPLLWSHVDFYLTDYKEDSRPPHLENLWLERAKKSQLCVHFYCQSNLTEDYLPPYTPKMPKLPQMLAALVPYAKQIVELDLRNFEFGHLVESLTKIRLAQSNASPVTTLHVQSIQPRRPIVDNSRSLAWPSNFFTGLSQLHLNGIPRAGSPTLLELVKALNSCPNLHTLWIINLFILEDKSVRNYPKINLRQLRFLSLHWLREEGSQKLLSLLRPGNARLHLEIDMVASPDYLNVNKDFITNFRVESLYLRHVEYWDYDDPEINYYLPCMRSVRTLVLSLDHCATGPHLSSLISKGKQNSHTPQLPNLRTLYLMGGRFKPHNSDMLKQIIASYSLNKLVLLSCIPYSQDYPESENEKAERRYKDVLDWIRRRVPIFQVMRNQHWSWHQYEQNET